MNIFVVLLRGVMPRGKNKVPMADLRVALTEAGFVDVQTYIQSGNVIVTTDLNALEVERLVHDTIVQKIGADVTVVAKTPAQLQQTLKDCPFPFELCARMYFTWLASKPASSLIEAFVNIGFAPDEIKLEGDVIYALYASDEHSNSKFNNNYFERKLKVSATTRNFNTLSRLIERTS